MKQHITITQLKEIGVEKLLPYFSIGNRTGYSISLERHGKEIADLVLCEGLNIGKMIEIIESNYPIINKELDEWIVTIYFDRSKKVIHATELVDGLWNAVKYVLN